MLLLTFIESPFPVPRELEPGPGHIEAESFDQPITVLPKALKRNRAVHGAGVFSTEMSPSTEGGQGRGGYMLTNLQDSVPSQERTAPNRETQAWNHLRAQEANSKFSPDPLFFSLSFFFFFAVPGPNAETLPSGKGPTVGRAPRLR